MATPDQVLLEASPAPGVLLLTLNRPRQLNAFNAALYEALTDALRRADSDDAITCIVITGFGTYFTSGADLRDATPPEEGFIPMAKALMSCSKILVAAVNGNGAVGVGVTLLPHCDLVFAADTATFFVPFVTTALVPELCSTVTFPQVLGTALSNDMLLAERRIGANEALAAGLVSRVVPAASLVDRTLAIVSGMLAKPLAHRSLLLFKRMIKSHTASQLAHAFAMENGALLSRIEAGDPMTAAILRMTAAGGIPRAKL